jgi:drug/metabolite transporter (DMT)-like permease
VATAWWTLFAMLAFAANSLLCRMALGDASIDPASFSTLRIVSGAVTLAVLVAVRHGRVRVAGSWPSAAALFLYAVPFSFAYVSLATGMGALILFGAVQSTMMVAAVASGERPTGLQWTGLLAALGGLAYLVFPGLQAPSPLGAFLMVAAGVAWGAYSLRGRAVTDPLRDTAGNFARAVVLVLLVSVGFYGDVALSVRGAVLAVASGALASGIGYAVWYTALRGLTATRAAIVQLSVPVIAALAGVIVLDEVMTQRLVIAASAILGGVACGVVGGRKRR